MAPVVRFQGQDMWDLIDRVYIIPQDDTLKR